MCMDRQNETAGTGIQLKNLNGINGSKQQHGMASNLMAACGRRQFISNNQADRQLAG